MKSSYITSAQKAEQLPEFPHPEVAFVGRSNVGKSSLLNALLQRRGLARTSNTPGRTQMVNFFSVEKGERQMIFADLPGYGYSAVGREARKDWVALMDKYLARRGIHAFLFLLDSRRAADMADEDLELIKNLADRRAPEGVTVVLTKSDKLSANELQKTLKSVKGTLAASRLKSVRIMAVSTLKDKGMEDLRRLVLAPLD